MNNFKIPEVGPKIEVPSVAAQYIARGDQFFLAGNMAGAEACFIEAVKLEDGNADAWCSLGLVWNHHDHYEDAFKCFAKAISINPRHAQATLNLGTLHEALGNLDHAERCYRVALEFKEMPRARANLGMLLLRKFQFSEGFALQEARFDIPLANVKWRNYDVPKWDGLPTPKLAIWAEQGVGDQILYSTLLPALQQMGQPFEVEVDKRMLALFRRSYPKVNFIEPGSGFSSDVTAHIPMMSLAWYLRPNLEAFNNQRYITLVPDGKRSDEFAKQLGSDRKNVAISWRSFKPEMERHVRERKSTTLGVFAPLAARDDVQLVNVQYGNVDDEIRDFKKVRDIYTLDKVDDIDGVVALIDACDVLVTTSNVAVHYAGAIGKRAILICKDAPILYYHCTPDGQHLWYPSVAVVSRPTWVEAIAAVNEMI